MTNRFFLSGGIALLIAVAGAIFPLVFYYSKLPPAGEVKPGVNLTQLFLSFDKQFSSSVNSDDVSKEMLCLSCLPNASSSKACIKGMSYFVAKNLADVPNSMLSWHLSNAYLTKAVSMKYEEPVVSSIYFAMLANVFHEKDLSSLCYTNFGKSCDDLHASELRILQRAFLSGKMPPPDGPPDEVFATCFSN